LRIGTKSVLIGAHQFLLHPALIALGWWKAYGFGRVKIGERDYARLLDPRLWVVFLVHDLGYLGKPNMDGPEGETHPEFGALLVRRLFGNVWGDLSLLHSRYYAKKLGRPVSPLCLADKWVILLEPAWLYLPRVRWSGELREFMAVAMTRAASVTSPTDPLDQGEIQSFRSGSPVLWHRALRSYMRRWIQAHADGGADTWTKVRHSATDAG
jgi:hypothetical protein